MHVGHLGHFSPCFLDLSGLRDDCLCVFLDLLFFLCLLFLESLHLVLESVFLFLLASLLSLFDFLSGLRGSFRGNGGFGFGSFFLDFLSFDLKLTDSLFHLGDLNADCRFFRLTGSHLSGLSLDVTLVGFN